MTNEVKMQFPCGQQCTLLHNKMDLNKHFIVTLQRNVGGGTAGAQGGGGCLETYSQDRTLRKKLWDAQWQG